MDHQLRRHHREETFRWTQPLSLRCEHFRIHVRKKVHLSEQFRTLVVLIRTLVLRKVRNSEAARILAQMKTARCGQIQTRELILMMHTVLGLRGQPQIDPILTFRSRTPPLSAIQEIKATAKLANTLVYILKVRR